MNSLRLPLAGLLLGLLCALAISAQAPTELEENRARALVREARNKEAVGDLAGAVRDYELVTEQFPATSAAGEALLHRARLLEARGEIFTAQQLLERLITSGPRSPYGAAAYVLQARIRANLAEGREQLEQALVPLRRVPLLFDRQTHPYLEARAEARALHGELLIRLGKTDAAGASWLDVLELEGPSRWKAPAAVRLAEVLAWRGDWRAAAGLLQGVIDGDYPGEAEWREMAGRRLALVLRLRVRPEAGQSPWTVARRVTVPGGLKKPVGVAADEAGRLLIADQGSPALVVLDADGRVEVRHSIKDLGKPWWDFDGGAYFVSKEEIYLPFERARRPYSERTPKNKLEPLKKMSAGASGSYRDLVLLDQGPSRVLRFAENRRFLGTVAPEEKEPVDVAARPQGGFLVLYASGEVERFDHEGRRAGRLFKVDFKKPTALAIDRFGDVFVLDAGRKRIEVYRPDGSRLYGLGPELPGGISLSAPGDLAVDGSGRLFVADSKASLIVLEGGT